MATDHMITNIVLDAAMMPEMSEREKALRDLFVREYFVDYNEIAACLRCGFMRSFAEEYAKKFMAEPYVRQQLAIMEQTAPLPNTGNKNADDFNRQRIIQGLFKEAHDRTSSGSARVSALKELAEIYKLKEPTKAPEDNNKKHRGGVIQVPEIADVTKWEEVAVATQEKLVEDVRN
jgi:hypothetical protein